MIENKSKVTEFGFVMGSMEITRVCSDNKWGSLIEVKTAREILEIRATPSGLLRVGRIKRKKEYQYELCRDKRIDTKTSTGNSRPHKRGK